MKADPAVAALKRVQQAIRSTTQVAPDECVRSQRVPGTRGSDSRYIMFNAAGRSAVEKAAHVLGADERFEHMRNPEDAIWELATAVAVDKTSDFVASFVERHSRPVQELRCFVAIDHLKTSGPWRVGAVEFLPLDHETVPKPSGWFRPGVHWGTVAATTVAGTNLGRMADRARIVVDDALRLMRLDLLTSQMGITDAQMRFRTGDAYAFSEELTGWRRSPGEAIELEAITDLSSHLISSPLGQLLQPAHDDLTSAMRVAATWLERALFSADPLVDILFSFFGLEALLGRKSDALKGDSLAVRQMTLDHELTGAFAHPNKLWQQYDQIRSAAVHGSITPAVDARDARELRYGVTRTLEQVITLADREGIQRKDALLRWLDNHQDLPALAEWLIQYGGSDWRNYFATILEMAGARPTPPS